MAERSTVARARSVRQLRAHSAAHNMPKEKRIRPEDDKADEQLFEALRQLADEALEEEIPERLLRLIRAAEGQQEPGGEHLEQKSGGEGSETPPDQPATKPAKPS